MLLVKRALACIKAVVVWMIVVWIPRLIWLSICMFATIDDLSRWWCVYFVFLSFSLLGFGETLNGHLAEVPSGLFYVSLS